MEAKGNGDGASDVSYESAASEGGYEPAGERGRDPLPRIISSSHCVEVFRRIRWVDGAFCCRLQEDAKGNGGKGADMDPLSGLPSRIMGFDGAMEAWLEEMPLARVPGHVPRPYAALNDASNPQGPQRTELPILRAGNKRATIWYFTLEFLQQLWPLFLAPDPSGMKLWERALLDRGCTIQSTHIEVGQVHCPHGKEGKQRLQWLKSLFAALQASKWTPDGEARSLLIKRRLSHASMSIGDAVQIGSELFVAGLAGFVQVKEGDRLLPPNFEPENEEPEPSSARGKEAANKKEASKEGSSKDEGGTEEAGKEAKGRGRKKKGAKAGKGAKGRGKGGGEGRGKGDADEDSMRGKDRQRAKEPGPADRADRRKLRAQLQARREQLQAGGH